MPQYTKLSRSETAQLNKKLISLITAILILLVLIFSAVVFFAPQVGSFFGLFSVNRNKPEEETVIKPGPPVFSNIPKASNKEKISINGYSQPGYTVNLYVNGPLTDHTIVGADGLFTFNDVPLISGQNTIFAKSVDNHNSESDSTSVFTVYVDKEKPKLEIISPKDKEVVKNLDKRIVIEGKVNEKSQIKINGKFAILKPDLSFYFLLGTEKEGDIKITVEAVDEAGNSNKEEITVNYRKSSN